MTLKPNFLLHFCGSGNRHAAFKADNCLPDYPCFGVKPTGASRRVVISLIIADVSSTL